MTEPTPDLFGFLADLHRDVPDTVHANFNPTLKNLMVVGAMANLLVNSASDADVIAQALEFRTKTRIAISKHDPDEKLVAELEIFLAANLPKFLVSQVLTDNRWAIYDTDFALTSHGHVFYVLRAMLQMLSLPLNMIVPEILLPPVYFLMGAEVARRKPDFAEKYLRANVTLNTEAVDQTHNNELLTNPILIALFEALVDAIPADKDIGPE